MKLAQRLERLEIASTEADYRRWAERLAGELGVPAEQLARELIEIAERIERWGLHEELRRTAKERSLTEEEVREHFEEELRRTARERGWTEEESREYYQEALATAPKDNED